ncbi:MAG: hypothetical protein HOF72_01405, partial [Planctomycetaceae bacterium]|nr:hypothetical protein [Planctomycetaceae bacterium]
MRDDLQNVENFLTKSSVRSDLVANQGYTITQTYDSNSPHLTPLMVYEQNSNNDGDGLNDRTTIYEYSAEISEPSIRAEAVKFGARPDLDGAAKANPIYPENFIVNSNSGFNGRYRNQTYETYNSNYGNQGTGYWTHSRTNPVARFYWQDWDNWSNPTKGHWDVDTRYWYTYVGGHWNDDIEAIWLWPNSKIEMYQHSNFDGYKKTYITPPGELTYDNWAIPHSNSPLMSATRNLPDNYQHHLSSDGAKNDISSFKVWTWRSYTDTATLQSNPTYTIKDGTTADNVHGNLRDIKYTIDGVEYTLVGDPNLSDGTVNGATHPELQGNDLEMEKEFVAALDNFDHSYYTYSTFGVDASGNKVLESVAVRRRNDDVVGEPGQYPAGEAIYNQSKLDGNYYITAGTWPAFSGLSNTFTSANVNSFFTGSRAQTLRTDIELPIEDGQLIRKSPTAPYHSIDIETFKDDAGFYLPSFVNVISTVDVVIEVPHDYVQGKRVDQQITIDGTEADTYTLNIPTISPQTVQGTIQPTSVQTAEYLQQQLRALPAFNRVVNASTTPLTQWIQAVNHGFAEGDEVIYHTSASSISGLSDNNTYFVMNVEYDQFQLSAEAYGDVITFNTSGTGTQTLTGSSVLVDTVGTDSFEITGLPANSQTIELSTASNSLISDEFSQTSLPTAYDVTYDTAQITALTNNYSNTFWFGGIEIGQFGFNDSATSYDLTGDDTYVTDVNLFTTQHLQNVTLSTGPGADIVHIQTCGTASQVPDPSDSGYDQAYNALLDQCNPPIDLELIIDTTEGNDTITIESLNAATTILAGDDDDEIFVNYDKAQNSTQRNGLYNNILTLHGEDGGDDYEIGLASVGSSTINVFDQYDLALTHTGTDQMKIYGTDNRDFFLFRRGAIIAYPRSIAEAIQPGQAVAVERVNYDGNLDSGVNVYGRAEADMFVFDDTSSVITAFGDEGDDIFQIGQMFKSPRNAYANLPEEDWFTTTFTTRGYLSNGNSFSTSLYGGDGDDNFVVYHNLATLGLFGENDDDKFTVRAFVELDEDEATKRLTNINGGQGGDFVEYAVNAPVDIDGGDGFDTMVIIGTEFGDDIVVTQTGVYGAGLFVEYRGVESIEVDMAEGNDRFYVFGTPAGVSTNLIGGRGSDTFNVGGVDGLEDPLTVVSNDLRGHTGIINHTIATSDSHYGLLDIPGVSANVGDADSPGVMIIESGNGTQVAEAGINGLAQIDVYDVVLTMAPIENIIITVTPDPPREDDFENGARSVYVRKSNAGNYEDSLQLTFTPTNWMVPQIVQVQAAFDEISEGRQNYTIKHSVVQGTNAEDQDAYDALPVPSVLVEVTDNESKEIAVRMNTVGSDAIASPWLHEASQLDGQNATYVVTLTKVPTDTVTITLANNDDVTYSTNTLTFTAGNWSTPQSINVTVVDDTEDEGNHFATIVHTITSNDTDYAEIGTFNVEFPVSDNEKPEILVLPVNDSINVIEPTTSQIIYNGDVASSTNSSITMPALVLNVNTGQLRKNAGFRTATNLERYTDSWSKLSNTDISNSTTIPHITVDGVGTGAFANYKFDITSSMLAEKTGGTLQGTFDIDGGKNSTTGSFDPYLQLYKQNTFTGFFGFLSYPYLELLGNYDDKYPIDSGTNHAYDSFSTYNFDEPGTYVVRVGRYPKNSPIPVGATYQLHVSLENHETNSSLPDGSTFIGDTIVITSGPGKGQERTVSDFDALTNKLDVSVPWDENPDSSSQFAIRKQVTGTTSRTDQYTVVLTGAPSNAVSINLVPTATKTYNEAFKFDESQNKGQRTAEQIEADKTSLAFTTGNWYEQQVVTISGISDNYSDGDASISFPDAKRQVTEIRGPLSIDGYEPDGQARNLEDPLLVPGETNLPPPNGTIIAAGDDD